MRILSAIVPQLSTYLGVALGGALGSVLRFWLSGILAHGWGEKFPLGTLFVNATGSFLIGFFATLTAPEGRVLLGSMPRQFVMIGVLGGYTTFSSFSLQTLSLAREGEWFFAGANVMLSMVLCLGAVALGHVCAAALNR